MSYLKKLLRESGFAAIDVEVRAFLLYSALLGDTLRPQARGRFRRQRLLAEAVALLIAPAGRTGKRKT